MAEQFGEAEVVLRARLDELQRDLDQAEQYVAAQTQRIATSQQEITREIHNSTAAAEGGGGGITTLGLAALAAHGKIKLLQFVLSTLVRSLMLIPAAAIAAKVAIVGLATSGVALLGLALGTLADKALATERAIKRVVAAGRELDGSAAKAEAFSDALRDIPIIGRAANQVWAMFGETLGATSEQQLAAWTALVAKVEDGKVEIGLVGRALNGLLAYTGPGIIARMLGLDTDIVGQVDDINASIDRMRERSAAQNAILPAARELSTSAADARIRREQEAALAQVEGVERVKLAEDQRHQNLLRQHEKERTSYNAKVAAEMAKLRESGASREAIDAAQNASAKTLAAVEKERRDELAASLILKREAVKLAEEEAEALRKARLEQIKAEDLATVQRNSGLRTGARSTRLRSAGRDFEADRIENESTRNVQLAALGVDDDKMIALINEYYDARADAIDKRERDEMERQKQLADEAAGQRIEQVKDLQSELKQLELNAAGDRVAAAQEAIRRRAERQIKQLIADGNTEAAEIVKQIRDAQLAATERTDSVRRQQEASQVSLSRTVLEGLKTPGEDEQTRLAKDQLDTQKRIAKNTERPPVARAG